MAITKPKRQKMEKLIQDTFMALDPSGMTADRYKQKFKAMNDAQFDTFFKKLFASDEYLVLDVVEYERDLRIENVEDGAKVLGIPLFEKVAMPFVNGNSENPITSKYEVPVGYLHIKRMQQMLQKKNTTSTEIASRSAMTGQVVGKDKNARDSDMENFALATLGAEKVLKEFMGPRADDMVAKTEMYSEIASNGYVSLDTLTDSLENKTTLNTIDVILIGMGIKSDLVTKGLQVNGSLQK